MLIIGSILGFCAYQVGIHQQDLVGVIILGLAALIMYTFGFINLYMKNFGAAEENLRRCIEAKPDYSQAYSAMGVLMEEYRKQFQAESYYRKAIELDSMNAFAYANLGVLLVQQDDEKKRKEGRTYIEKAISLDPELAKREDIIQLLRTRTQ
jgi:Tfp pilus assembly protein PilF